MKWFVGYQRRSFKWKKLLSKEKMINNAEKKIWQYCEAVEDLESITKCTLFLDSYKLSTWEWNESIY